ncbi:hypothetical protein DL546_004156 [Coniochaeta pulveracea]|uniref:Uncharacterized protein n=1 Tax=Coniochaeta pulveracea TaxID=177199 RepID=A0A420Y8U0_9PEZI|nr:hypothetical protein DL546_004156 [Coniochaeta pulveracea]
MTCRQYLLVTSSPLPRAPFRSSCDSKKGSEVWTTDQNWQGDVHNRLGDWAKYLWKSGTAKPKGTLTVFPFKLRTVNDADSRYAGWVEANGKIRLCLGPGLSSGGRDCWMPLTDAESKMVTW